MINHQSTPTLRRVARFLRRNPWIMALSTPVFRLTRPRLTVGVVGVILDDAGRVLLAEHVFHPVTPWGLPGGWMDRREQPAQTARREIHEELSLDVRIETLLLAEIHYPHHLDIAFLCRPDGPVGALSSELLDYAWFAPGALPPLLPFHRRAVWRALNVDSLEFNYEEMHGNHQF